ncbi:GTP cyclohydrolase I FolE [Spongiivirga sp. MCCC 1A20706]|uniref:GTP cyclohydrolase I FolE n=1 Tax=Spongiivirga sp. MCCC 1A20706 TaxID=3160963 RepID=UPI003977B897
MDESEIDILGDNHIATSVDTPMREDAFVHTDDEKIKNIQFHFSKIMEELGLDLTDESLSGTPYRFAKMYVKELFYGLNPKNRPKVSTFPNTYGYQRMLVEKDINIDSSCEHHFLPITGYAHVGYIPKDKVVGLSKINRLVDYYAHKPQVQERLCLQILKDLQQTLDTEDVIVVIHAKHLCVSSRGIKDKESATTTFDYGGVFADEAKRAEFFNLLKKDHSSNR